MQSSQKTYITLVTQWLLWSAFALITLVFIPYFFNYLIMSKVLFVLVMGLLVVALYILNIVFNKNISLVRHPLVLPIFLFGLAATISTFTSSSYPVENILGLGGVYISFAVVALLGGSLLSKDALHKFTPMITTISTILAISTVLQTFGLGVTKFTNAVMGTQLPNTNIYNVTGSAFLAVQLFGIVILTLGISGFLQRKFTTAAIVGMVASFIGLAFSVYPILPGKEATPILLPASASWSIALDTLHNFRSAAVGIGPENYQAAYNQFRPAWTNGQSWWNLVFTQATNLPLTLIVTTGFLGLASWLYFVARLLLTGLTKNNLSNPAAVMAIGLGILHLIVPAHVVTLGLQSIALAVWLASYSDSTHSSLRIFDSETIRFSPKTQTTFKLIGLSIVALILGSGFYGIIRAYRAGYYFYQAINFIQQNRVVEGYTAQQKAVTYNPYLSLYRSEYALTNMSIALAISNKADLTQEEKTQVTQLVSQSIREAKATTALRPELSSSWATLARVYRKLIGTADGADQWTITSYVSAIERAPQDPFLRAELGKVFYDLKQYSQAVSLFSQTADIKPDFVMAYYYGANSLKQLGNLEGAEQAYQKTLSLLAADSDDYMTVNKELEQLQAQIKKVKAQQPSVSPTANKLEVPSITQENLNQSGTNAVLPVANQDLVVQPPATTPSSSPALLTQ